MMEQRDRRTLLRSYELVAAVVWAAPLTGVAVVLQGTPYLAQVLPILGGGAAFFVVVLPVALYRTT